MRNPYLFGYLPFLTITLFSLTFGVFMVGTSIKLFGEIGLYAGMREFLTDSQLRLFLLVIYSLAFFMIFSALKLIAETIHETAMLFFSKDAVGESYSEAKSGNLIYFFGALASVAGVQSIQVLLIIFLLTTFVYFVYMVFKLSKFMTLSRTVGLLFFEIIVWGTLLSVIIYILLKLYNGILASLPVM
ncbi:DUF5366 family protein [Sporosarcina thermotolerans]|uniref:DUF5366 family protein n=1 Tax=Sporosarcina thermotolerans TaxID=633404 RepID=A0AAW9ABL8_9BACL|nr:DUF5366 family protein [Sporosarcina thermotolerans]MDW0117604.1 DUF5366 family protein [Sporosarcina thermotolerans]WHT49749.1 DUF5366 family protein [Sporosarcina thermotolerans]